MPIKVVEYVHEYDEPDWENEVEFSDSSSFIEIPATKRVNFTSHVTETYFAVQTPDSTRTNIKGEIVNDFAWMGHPSYLINGTSLTIYSREDILGYLGLLNKLLEEFPEDD